MLSPQGGHALSKVIVVVAVWAGFVVVAVESRFVFVYN